MRLPMFPLGTVVFPGTAVPLRVFEDRYQALLDRVLGGDRRFGTVLIERGFEVGGGDSRFGIGTLLEVVAVEDLADGHRGIVAAGIRRIAVSRWLEDDPHPRAEVHDHPDAEEGSPDLDGARRRLEKVLVLASELGLDVVSVGTALPSDPGEASFRLASLCPVTPLDSQSLLEAAGPRSRVRMAIDMLDAQAEVLALRLGG